MTAAGSWLVQWVDRNINAKLADAKGELCYVVPPAEHSFTFVFSTSYITRWKAEDAVDWSVFKFSGKNVFIFFEWLALRCLTWSTSGF